MGKIVKLILVCQIKDEDIPQLMPLLWILSSFVLFVVFLVVTAIYGLGYYKSCSDLICYKNSSMFWWW